MKYYVIGFSIIWVLSFFFFVGFENKKDLVLQNVVKVLGERGGGTGVVVKYKQNRFVLTNAHVCQLGHSTYLRIGSTNRNAVDITEVYESKRSDLCYISLFKQQLISMKGITVAKKFGNYLEKAYVIGHPLLIPIVVSEGKYQKEWQVKDKFNNNISVQIITNFVYPGNSGSPVVNENYELTNLIFAGFGYMGSLGIAVTYSDIKNFLDNELDSLDKIYLKEELPMSIEYLMGWI